MRKQEPLEELLQPFSAEETPGHPASAPVSSPRSQGAELIAGLELYST